MNKDLENLLKAALYAFNSEPRFNLIGCPGDYKDSYEIAKAIEKYLESHKETYVRFDPSKTR